MTDTNQLPEPELGYIQTDKSNQPAFSARQMREAMKHALQARAQVQGHPSWWMRETDEGAEWTDTAPLVLSGWTPLYTTPQPAQATQTYVTDKQILSLDCVSIDSDEHGTSFWVDRGTVIKFARAILALRPERAPMTEEEIVHAYCGCKENDAPAGVWFEAGARAAEKHHFGTKLKEQA